MFQRDEPECPLFVTLFVPLVKYRAAAVMDQLNAMTIMWRFLILYSLLAHGNKSSSELNRMLPRISMHLVRVHPLEVTHAIPQ